MSKYAEQEKKMSATKHAAVTVATALLIAAGPASAHPTGHGGFSLAELVAHLSTNAFHIGVIVAAFVAIALMRRGKGAADTDGSEAANE